MKNLFLAVLSGLLLSCSTDSQTTQESKTEVTPVYNLNGLYNRVKGKHYVNIQWYSDYGFPNLAYTPHYVTIKRDGVVVASNYQEQFNRFGVQVPSNWQQSTFEVTQTVIGAGTSQPSYVTIYRTY